MASADDVLGVGQECSKSPEGEEVVGMFGCRDVQLKFKGFGNRD